MVGLKEKPDPELFFNTNKGKLRIISEWKNGAGILSNDWPVEAGILGLQPSPDNEFYRYLVDNVEFYGDAEGDSKTSHLKLRLSYNAPDDLDSYYSWAYYEGDLSIYGNTDGSDELKNSPSLLSASDSKDSGQWVIFFS